MRLLPTKHTLRGIFKTLWAADMPRIFRYCEEIFDFCLQHSKNIPIFASPKGAIWSDGRVARHRSAKPYTAVRIRFRPRKAFQKETPFLLYNFLIFLGGFADKVE